LFPNTGEYIKHTKKGKFQSAYYTFTPRPLTGASLYELDDELAAMLIDAHHRLGFLKGLVKYARNKTAFSELMLLRECTFSRLIDYSGPTFRDVLIGQGTGKGASMEVKNLVLAYQYAVDKEISSFDLSKICGIALHGSDAKNAFEIRENQTFLSNVSTNLPGYNPTAPENVLQALADIYKFLHNNRDMDILIKASLVHYQFEMIHPYEKYNGIMGRIIVYMLLREALGEALPLLCLSEFLYNNKNDYFDLLSSTQYSGGYIRWIKFHIRAVCEMANKTAEWLIQYERTIEQDIDALNLPDEPVRSVWAVYYCLTRRPITDIGTIAKLSGLSYNTASSAMRLLRDRNIVIQYDNQNRNRIWVYQKLEQIFMDTLIP